MPCLTKVSLHQCSSNKAWCRLAKSPDIMNALLGIDSETESMPRNNCVGKGKVKWHWPVAVCWNSSPRCYKVKSELPASSTSTMLLGCHSIPDSLIVTLQFRAKSVVCVPVQCKHSRSIICNFFITHSCDELCMQQIKLVIRRMWVMLSMVLVFDVFYGFHWRYSKAGV